MRALALLMLLSTACSTAAEPGVCPSIVRHPYALVHTAAPLGAGTYELTVKADGAQEQCTLTISTVGGATEHGDVVQSPSTRTDTTCTKVSVAYVNNDGSISDLRTEGTPAALAVTLGKDGIVIGVIDTAITYTPTAVDGPGCSVVERAEVRLTSP